MVSATFKLPKPGAAKQIEQEDVPPPDVERGDELYFRHPKHGPTHGRVAAHGKHGCMIDCAADKKRYRVPWEHVLGHRVKVQPGYKVVDQGEDGFIASDPGGRRRYIHDPDPDVDTGEEPIRKSLMPIVLLFGDLGEVMKAVGGTRYIKNRPGLALQDVTDKQGKQTKRWKKTGAEEPKQRATGAKREEPKSTKRPVGTEVSFYAGGKSGRGKVSAAGADGAVVRDAAGVTHKVYWHEMKSPAPATKRETKSPKNDAAASGDGSIPAEQFNAHEYAAAHTDNEVTPDEVLARFAPEVAEEMSEINERVKAATPTTDTFKRDGKWVPERLALHAKIKREILTPERVSAALPSADSPATLTLLGGRGGSGKGSLKGRVYDEDRAIVLDADKIKEKLPEYEGWNAGQVHEESSEILDSIAEECRQAGLNVVVDATMRSAGGLMDRARVFKESGYRLCTHYMFFPRQEAGYRTVKRFLGKDGKRGRYAPIDAVLSNVNNEANFDQVRKLADEWSFYDNSGDAPTLVSSSGKKATVKKM